MEIQKNAVPEWIKFYINVRLLKAILSCSSHVVDNIKARKLTFEEKRHLINQIMQENFIIKKLKEDNISFLSQLRYEIQKVEDFTIIRYQNMRTTYQKLQNQIKIMMFLKNRDDSVKYSEIKALSRKELRNKALILKQSCFNFYVEIIQFESYLETNEKAIMEILQYYKKQMLKTIRNRNTESANIEFIQEELQMMSLIKNKTQLFHSQLEKRICYQFYVNPKYGKEDLEKYRQQKVLKISAVYKLGIFAGIALIMITLIFCLRVEGYVNPDNKSNIFSTIFPCFRGSALILIYYWYFAIILRGWNINKINYKLFLGFNFHFSTVAEVLKRAGYLSAIYLTIFTLYSLQAEGIGFFKFQDMFNLSLQFFPTDLLPLIIWITLFIYFLIPTRYYFNGQGRRWMFRMFYGVIYLHAIKYEARYTFILDQICSLILPMRDIDYTICYYYHQYALGQDRQEVNCYFQNRLSGALIAIIPFSLKCIHDLTRAKSKGAFWGTDEMKNFFKNLLAVLISVLFYLQNNSHRFFKYAWIPAALSYSFIQFYWDMKREWLLLEPGSKNKFLRSDLGYEKPYIYYTFAVVDFILHLTWILTISPEQVYQMLDLKDKELLLLIVGFLEISRRNLNNFFRIEKEYILNLRNLKSIQEVQYPFQELAINQRRQTQDNESISTLRSEQSSHTYIRLSKVMSEFQDLVEESSNDIFRNYKSGNPFEKFVSKKVEAEIINKYKSEEKFQVTRIKALKENKREFIRMLEELEPFKPQN
ncbi:hypothetical protein pb186bvf_002269 [Paramecium bursaria]